MGEKEGNIVLTVAYSEKSEQLVFNRYGIIRKERRDMKTCQDTLSKIKIYLGIISRGVFFWYRK
ncbi:MAG: hypothetical protein HUJ74_03340 [Lachnospiraceae bacterium]|nr:hypothetical protein [Lachnospiraceae bacterium]